MSSPKPQKTIADYVVNGFGPVLIMLLVGTLVFFLIQVFYRGQMAASIRWVMFWFVLAVVLVSRIGIEEGTGRAFLYGFGVAGATGLYLMRTDPSFLFGMVLLALVWWCAHKLTWNCTVIDDDDEVSDASGRGLLQTLPDFWPGKNKPKKPPLTVAQKRAASIAAAFGSREARRSAKPHPAGLWVIYFSVAALPLFGVGQALLPANDVASRRLGFVFLLGYLAAALGLFVTTSFLGLRRYLRQRRLKMPRAISIGWLRFGAGVIFVVMALALLLPRPGSDYTWKTVAVKVDGQLRRASQYAAQFNPRGKGKGRPGKETDQAGDQTTQASAASTEEEKQKATEHQPGESAGPKSPDEREQGPPQSPAAQIPAGQGGGLYKFLRGLLVVTVACLLLWWLVRQRSLIFQAIRSLVAAVMEFFRNLAGIKGMPKRATKAGAAAPSAPAHPFAAYKNPFITGEARAWAPERLIVYTYEAVQAWAKERGIDFPPQQTPREFCADLGEKYPDVGPELSRLTFYYAHAAYGKHLPDSYDPAPVRELWRRISDAA